MSDELRLALKRLIYTAWAKRRQVTKEVVGPLSCYDEREPFEKRGLIELTPTDCSKEQSCCLAGALRANKEDLRRMKAAIDASGSERGEDRRRAQALRFLYRKSDPVDDKTCRSLGDAIFVAFAPKDSVILTTNVRDPSC